MDTKKNQVGMKPDWITGWESIIESQPRSAHLHLSDLTAGKKTNIATALGALNSSNLILSLWVTLCIYKLPSTPQVARAQLGAQILWYTKKDWTND